MISTIQKVSRLQKEAIGTEAQRWQLGRNSRSAQMNDAVSAASPPVSYCFRTGLLSSARGVGGLAVARKKQEFSVRFFMSDGVEVESTSIWPALTRRSWWSESLRHWRETRQREIIRPRLASSQIINIDSPCRRWTALRTTDGKQGWDTRWYRSIAGEHSQENYPFCRSEQRVADWAGNRTSIFDIEPHHSPGSTLVWRLL